MRWHWLAAACFALPLPAAAQALTEVVCVGEEQMLIAGADDGVTSSTKPLEWRVRFSFEPPVLQAPGGSGAQVRLQGSFLIADTVVTKTDTSDPGIGPRENSFFSRHARLDRRSGLLTVLRTSHLARYGGTATQPTTSAEQIVQWQSLRCRGAPF